MILLISLPHFDLLSERILERVIESHLDLFSVWILERIFESLESLQDVVAGGAGLAPLLDRIFYPRSVFSLSP